MPNVKEKQKKLPKRFKERWVKALRSGKYKQGSNYLYSPLGEGNYCCLGVSCIIAGMKNEDIVGKGTINEEEFDRAEMTKIPKVLIGSDLENDLVSKLTKFNDGRKNKEPKSFNWIASYISRHL